MTFSERAKPLKDKGSLTLREIAEACNISESMASRYINGSVTPPDDIAAKILVLLGDEQPKVEITVSGEDDMQAALSLIKGVYEDRIKDIKEALKKEKVEKWVFVVLLAVVVAFVFTLFFVDLANGGVGWFRH